MSQEYGKFLTMALISEANKKKSNLRSTARAVGIAESLASDWVRGNVAPTDEEMQKICDYLECSLADVKKFANEQMKKQGATSETAEESSKPTTTKTEAKVVDSKKEAKTEEKVPEKEFAMPAPIKEEPKEEKVEKKTEKTPTEKKTVSATVTTVEKKRQTTTKPKAKPTVDKPVKVESKAIFSEETDAFIRKAAGLKKSDEITKENVLDTLNATSLAVKEQLTELSRLEQSITEALYVTLAEDKVEDRLRKLVNVARKASDEGLDLAITVLEKFVK